MISHSHQGLSTDIWEKLIPIAQLCIWNLCLLQTQQKIIQEFPLKRHRGASISSDMFNLFLTGCITPIQLCPKYVFFVYGLLYLVTFDRISFVFQEQSKRNYFLPVPAQRSLAVKVPVLFPTVLQVTSTKLSNAWQEHCKVW